jgi:hypothetical protein
MTVSGWKTVAHGVETRTVAAGWMLTDDADRSDRAPFG